MIDVYVFHGSGAGHKSDFFQTLTHLLEAVPGFKVTPITMGYMREMEISGKRRPPPKITQLVSEISKEIDPEAPCILIGKSMGARIIAELCATHNVQVCFALGYPFYPAKKPDKDRIGHLNKTRFVPFHILQGTRDQLGNMDWVQKQCLPENVSVSWIEGADHDFKCLKRYNVSPSDVVTELAGCIRTTCETLNLVDF